MRQLNPKYIQLVGDAVIPVLGFFLWHWSLYFIILFYFLDLATKEILLHVKSKKIAGHTQQINSSQFQKERSDWLKFGISSCLLLAFSIVLIQLSMPFIHPGFDYMLEIEHFWSYKELGIEQGYVLVPLIAFMGYTQYKMEFLMPALHTKISTSQLWKSHLKTMLVLVAFTGLTFGLVHFIHFPDWLIVVLIVVISSIYQLFFHDKKQS